jgi:hypothetical protein
MKRLLFLFLVACGSTQSVADGGTEGGGTDGGPAICGATQLADISLATVPAENPLDPLGYPPYALDGCQLVWVAKDGSLLMRDFSRSSGDVVIAPVIENPRRPTISGGIIAWESGTSVRWRDRTGNVATIPPGAYTSSGEPRAAKDAIVFTAWATTDPKGDTDVLAFSTDTKTVTLIGGGPAQQRFPDIDATRIAFADFSEGGPTGAFDAELMTDAGYAPADIVVVDRATQMKTTRNAPGKQAFPMLVTGGAVAYLDWSQVRPMPKFFSYGLKVGPVTGSALFDVDVPEGGTIDTNRPYNRPSVHAGLFQWIALDKNFGTGFYQRPSDLSGPATLVQSLPNAIATVTGDSLSLVAIEGSTGVTLLAIGH